MSAAADNGERRLEIRYALEREGFALDVDVSLAMRGITGIFGRSGAGKTSLLRCIAGLEKPARGRLVVDGDTLQDTGRGIDRAVHDRDLGYVFQEPRLFPHLDVRRNLDYGRRRARAAPAPGFDEVVALLGLEALLGRRPDGLSGGEAQRVAIARALLCSPRFILMDEPLAALDAERREEVLPFLDRLHHALAVPVLYVSHNIDEICLLCDQLLIMDGGQSLLHGALQDVLLHTDLPVLGGAEAGSVIEAVCREVDADYGLCRVEASGGELWVAGAHAPGSRVRLRLRANDISIVRERPQQTSILNLLPAEIESLKPEPGHGMLVHLRAGSDRLVSRITRRSAAELALTAGDRVILQVKSVSVRRA